MLGYALHRIMDDRGLYVVGTTRQGHEKSKWFSGLNYIRNVSVENLESIENAIASSDANLVINTIALKNLSENVSIDKLLLTNSTFPRQLYKLTRTYNVKLIHISTDAVYSLNGAPFTEDHVPKPDNLYGITKYLGEIENTNAVTLRLSLIGCSPYGKGSLVDWFKLSKGQVDGFSDVLFSGLTVNELANFIIDYLIPNIEHVNGIYNLSTTSISKYELLMLIRDRFKLQEIDIMPNSSRSSNRTLNSSALRLLVKYSPPEWPELIHDMHTFYEEQNQRTL